MQNKSSILRLTNNGLDVFKHYIQGDWRIGRNFLNLLYEDRKASCNIYFDRRNDCYRMKDFGNDTYSGDCFDIVGKLKGLDCSNPKDFIEILQVINRDMNLGLSGGDASFVVSVSPKPVSRIESGKQADNPKKTKTYSTVQQLFSAKETAFWK